MNFDYPTIVRELRQKGRLSDPDIPVVDVGRNPVWRVGGPQSEAAYVKIAEGSRWFERELYGLELSRQLAGRHDWIMAPQVRYMDRELNVHVTESLPGVTVAALLRRGFRIDRNPLKRGTHRRAFARALEAVVRWLSAFHSVDSERIDELYDHTLDSVRDRVVAKLRREIRAGSLDTSAEKVDRLKERALPAPSSSSTVIGGDATLGNFLWDGARIGRVDFEDMGWGAPARDFFAVREQLNTVEALIWYWSVSSVMPIVPDIDRGVEKHLYRLEGLLDQYRRFKGTAGGRASARAESDLKETLARTLSE